MPDSPDAERMVLESWKKERAELDSLISIMEKKIAARGGTVSVSVGANGEIGSDEFFRMSTPDAIKKFLKIVGRPARPTTDIVDGLKRGGLTSSYANTYTALTRLQKKGVAKVGDDWGLEEWYPPAPRETKGSTERADAENPELVAEPSEPPEP